MVSPLIPAGIRRNNPGNIRYSEPPWLGCTGDDNGFCVFDAPVSGIRALAKQLLIYQWKHNCRTVRQFIERWAPENENNTAAYVTDVAQRMGVDADASLQLTPETLRNFVCAITHHENGVDPYTDDQVSAGVSMAFV
jgi:hypothetical protein